MSEGTQRIDPATRARVHREAMRRRARRIRRAVAGVASSLFVAAFLAIYIPTALSAGGSSSSTATAAVSSTGAAQSSSSGEGKTSTSERRSSEPAAVTTSQS